MGKRKYIIAAIAALALSGLTSSSFADSNSAKDIDSSVSINLGSGLKIVSISHPDEDFEPSKPLSQTLTRDGGNPTTPLAGFSPFVAVMASDDSDSSSTVATTESGYTGNPLVTNPDFPDMPYSIALLDSGSGANVLFGSTAQLLGLTGDYLTENTDNLTYIGPAELGASISYPIGIYAAGLDAINTDKTIDTNAIAGYSNTAVYAADPAMCNNNEFMSAILGRPFMTFYTTVIRNDRKYGTELAGYSWYGPQIELLPVGSTDIPVYTSEIPVSLINGTPLPISTSSYSDSDDDGAPDSPTLLAIQAITQTLPIDGTYTVDIEVVHNGITEIFTMSVETGSQATILSSAAVDALGITKADFTVDLCSFGGVIEDIPGCYLEQVSITTTDTPLDFDDVPVISADIALDNGIDGILGMNFFYNRNITFSPNVNALNNTATIYVSDPIDPIDADFDHSGEVDLTDFAIIAGSWLSSYGQSSYNIACDLEFDTNINDSDLTLFAQRWLNVISD